MGGDGDGSVVARGEGGDGVARGGGGPLSLHTLSGGQTWGHRVGLQIHWLPEMLILSFGRKNKIELNCKSGTVLKSACHEEFKPVHYNAI